MVLSVLRRQAAIANEALRQAVEGLDPDELLPTEAEELFDAFDQAVRSAATGCTLLARRVEDGAEWKRLGFGSPAEHLAHKAGTSLGAAKRKLDTSKSLRDLPETASQMAQGCISADQGDTIADAARANPGAERKLLATAKRSNLNQLRDEAQRAKAAADPSPDDTHRRLHKARRVTRFTDGEGARHLNISGPVDSVSAIEAELDRRLSVLIRQRPAGEPLECRDAMVFDAAVEMARRSQRADDPVDGEGRKGQGRPEHLALLRLDVAALWRGYVEGDELCEITGLGPIPVAVARRLLGNAVLKLIITKGEAVAQVTSLTRGPTQAMRYAMLWTSPTCVVEGCTRTITEYDHRWGAEYKDTRHTRLDETDPTCHTHHDLHTHHGWALVNGVGKRPMVPPDDPRHPRHTHGPAPGTGPPGHPPSPHEHAELFQTTDGSTDPAEPRNDYSELRGAIREVLQARAHAAHQRARPASR